MDGSPATAATVPQAKKAGTSTADHPSRNGFDDAGPAEIIERALTSAREILGMEMAYLADARHGRLEYRAVSGDGDSFGVQEDDSVPLEGTYCNLVLEGRLGLVTDAAADPLVRDLPITAEGEIGSYIGVPVTMHEGGVYGTFCCASHDPQSALGKRDMQFLELLARLIGYQLDREALQNERRRLANVTALLMALEARDGYTGDHSEAVVELAVATGRALGLSDAELADLDAAARLHDIGKIAISDSILRKPDKLDESEWEEMRRHSAAGAELVSAIPGLSHLAPLIRAEHERWDGAGYPDGLSGEEIPLISRIIFVCDAYHAMTSDRPYRKALPPEVALEELRRHAGTQFCPRCVEAAAGALAGGELSPARVG